MPEIDLEFGKLYVRVSGDSGPALILLHEYFGTGDSWDSQRSYFARSFTVFVPDLRGHGRSTIEAGRIRIEDLGNDILAIVDHFKLENAHVVGCSLGAVVGLHLARSWPQTVATLAVTSVPNITSEHARAYANDYAQRVFPDIEPKLDLLHKSAIPHYTRRMLLSSFLEDLEEQPADFRNAIEGASEIRSPTLVITGEQDPVFPPEDATSLMRAIPGANLAVLPATRHLVHPEMPGIFNELVLDHIRRSTR